MNAIIDFAKDAQPPPPDLLQRIAAKVAERRTMLKNKAAVEDVLKNLSASLDVLETKTLPDLMTEAGLKDFTLIDGSKVIIDQEVHASIPKASASAAFAWLRANKFDSIIKRLVGVQFGKGDDEIAAKLRDQLDGTFGNRLQVLDQEAVHPSTLKAFVKECLAEKIPIPEATFGVFKINRAIIKEPKSHE